MKISLLVFVLFLSLGLNVSLGIKLVESDSANNKELNQKLLVAESTKIIVAVAAPEVAAPVVPEVKVELNKTGKNVKVKLANAEKAAYAVAFANAERANTLLGEHRFRTSQAP